MDHRRSQFVDRPREVLNEAARRGAVPGVIFAISELSSGGGGGTSRPGEGRGGGPLLFNCGAGTFSFRFSSVILDSSTGGLVGASCGFGSDATGGGGGLTAGGTGVRGAGRVGAGEHP